LERHPSLAAVHYRAEWGTHGLARLVTRECERALGSVYLCTPTARAGQTAGHYLHAQWPDMPLVLLHERLGICLACAPLIALMLAVAAGQREDVLVISQWWDAWAMTRWPGSCSQVGH
jgi:hypothetical protein